MLRAWAPGYVEVGKVGHLPSAGAEFSRQQSHQGQPNPLTEAKGLQVGTISTEVVVQGSEVAQVETQSSDLGNTISGKEISQLELNGRDFTQLVTLSPGVTNQSGQDEGGEGATTVAFSINGGRTEYRSFEIDGGDALDNGSNTDRKS